MNFELSKLRNHSDLNDSEEIVQIILDSTFQVLIEIGYQNLSTNKIAKKSGFSIGTIYQYFVNKEHILLTILDVEFKKQYYRIGQLIRPHKEKNNDLIAFYFFYYLFEDKKTWHLISNLIHNIPLIEEIYGENTFSKKLAEFILDELKETYGITFDENPSFFSYLILNSLRSNINSLNEKIGEFSDEKKKTLCINLSELFNLFLANYNSFLNKK
jgi:AcrR family transcriptional regulator